MLHQGVVTIKRVRTHRYITPLDVIWQSHGERWWLVPGLAPSLKGHTYRIGMRYTTCECIGNAGSQFGDAVGLHEFGQRPCSSPQRFPALGGLRQQLPAGRNQIDQLIGATMRMGGTLVPDQRLDMFGQFDLLAEAGSPFNLGPSLPPCVGGPAVCPPLVTHTTAPRPGD